VQILEDFLAVTPIDKEVFDFEAGNLIYPGSGKCDKTQDLVTFGCMECVNNGVSPFSEFAKFPNKCPFPVGFVSIIGVV